MKIRPIRIAVGIMALAALASNATALEPILDLKVGEGGSLDDSSRLARKIELQNVVPGSKKNEVVLEDPRAVVIPYNESDPLYRAGSFTWMIKCKLNEIFAQANYNLAGRWESSSNQRVSNLSVNGKEGTLTFSVSSDGTTGSIVSCNQIDPLPSDPITIVVRFKAGEFVRGDVFDKDGKLLFKRMNGTNVPTVKATAPIPLVIGAPQKIGFSLSRFRVWNDALSDHQIEVSMAEDARR